MRKLASIQTVTEARPIPGADAIECLRILGWSVVAKKGEFATGDKVVYCEIDSLLPVRDEFEFLRPHTFKPAIVEGGEVVQRSGFRIRTVKLRGQVSQGIAFPLSILPEGTPTEVGADVTAALEVVKFEPPTPSGMGGRVKGGFPAFLPKTDEIRIQVLEAMLERRRGTTLFATEKLDGTSFTAFLREGEFGICSRNQWLDETDDTNVLARLATSLALPDKLAAIAERLGIRPAIQGEVIGPGIQGNKYGRPGVELHVFNLLDVEAYGLVEREAMREAVTAVGLTLVPDVDEIVLDHTIDELVEFSIGTSRLNPRVQREGLVFRPSGEEHDEDVGGRFSFKVINPKFLLRFDE